jgi:hypothetical protein
MLTYSFWAVFRTYKFVLYPHTLGFHGISSTPN